MTITYFVVKIVMDFGTALISQKMALSFLDKGPDSANRKRIFEEQRKRRIFNDKERQIGLDVEALEYQIHENQLARLKEARDEQAYGEEAFRVSSICENEERKRDEEVRRQRQQDDMQNILAPRPESQSEELRRERPPSPSHEFPVSSLQGFEGEDGEAKRRARQQADQQRDFLLQQMREKRQRRNPDWSPFPQDLLALQMQREEEEERRRVTRAVAEENRRLALERAERDLREKAEEDILKQKEIPWRSDIPIDRNEWRGMSEEQRQEYHEGRLIQMKERKLQKDIERREEADWAEQMRLEQQLIHRLQDQERRQEHDLNQFLYQKNRELAQLQRQRQEYLDNVVYSNQPTDEFYDQFNTTSR